MVFDILLCEVGLSNMFGWQYLVDCGVRVLHVSVLLFRGARRMHLVCVGVHVIFGLSAGHIVNGVFAARMGFQWQGLLLGVVGSLRKNCYILVVAAV